MNQEAITTAHVKEWLLFCESFFLSVQFPQQLKQNKFVHEYNSKNLYII